MQTMLDPTPAILGIVETAWTLLGEKKGSWDFMQKSMNKAKSDSLFNFDINSSGESNILQAKVLFEDTKEMLKQEKEKLDIVAEVLYQWESAIFSIYDETRRILATNKDLEEKKNELYNCLTLLKKQQRKYERLKIERDNFTKYRNTLEAKGSLLNELHELLMTETEYWKGLKEWEVTLEAIIKRQEVLIGDALFTAGILTYFGPFSWRSRERIKKQWVDILQSAKVKVGIYPKVGLLLGTDKQLADLHEQQLLVDDTSIENAFIKSRSCKWTLIIDPEGAASRWLGGRGGLKDSNKYFHEELLKSMGKPKHLVIHLSNERLPVDVLKLLELPIERKKNLRINFNSEHIKIEKQYDSNKPDPNTIEVNSKFSFTIRIGHSKPVFPDYIYELVNVINFSLSPKALEDNFMIEYGTYAASGDFIEAILKKKNPIEWDKEREEDTLLIKVKELELTKIDQEDQRKLKDLIGDTMRKCTELRRRISETIEEKMKGINEKIQAAEGLVSKVSVIYRSITRLTNMKANYLFTYQFVKDIFAKQLKDNTEIISEAQMNMSQLKERLGNISEYLISDVMVALKQVMFKRDYLKFTLYLAAKLSIKDKAFTKEEWKILLYGENYQPKKPFVNIAKNSLPQKITRGAWNVLGYLEEMLPDFYKGISQDIIKNKNNWETWAKDLSPHTAPLPELIESLKPLQILLLIRLICTEKVMTALEWSAKAVIGSIKKEPLKLQEIFKKETKIDKPLLILVDKEEDPTVEVMKLVHKEVKFESWALTRELESTIKRTLEECKRGFDREEQWFYIKDIDMIPGFGKYLVERLKEITRATEDDHSISDFNDKWFRLILTCHPCRLPRELLLNSVRVALGSPVTMKQMIIRDLNNSQQQEEKMLKVATNKDRYTIPYRRLILSFSILHATLNRRNRFGGAGWSKPFEVNEKDLELEAIASLNLVNNFKEDIPWKGMQEVITNVWLGGRIEDSYDKMILDQFVTEYFNEELTKGNYTFNEESFYRIPSQSLFDGMAKYIESQPNEEAYVLCGMDAMTSLIVERNEIESALDPLRRMEFAKNGAVESAKEVEESFVDSVFRAIPEVGFLKNHINPLIYEGKNKLPYAYNMYLLQEMNRYNVLIEIIHNTIAEISKFLKTGKLMSPSLEKIYASLAAGQIPEEFTGYPWNHPIAEWVTTFKARYDYIYNWLKTGATKTYWLKAFIYPKGLLNALLMTSAQRTGKEVENLSLAVQITSYNTKEDIKDKNPLIFHIDELYMLNAKYNPETKALDNIEEEEKYIKYTKLPIIAVIPTTETKEKSETFECPVYYLPRRVDKVGNFENLLMRVEYPTTNKDYWIMKQTFISCINPETNI